ncbi:hypothetical protein MCOR27_002808 [Pyricularia oryzae]|uniref:Tyrosine specific protein phosphatases domain-containing protein n=2 Tax=Pyricularia TaxID=48558 RepID=A0ABQ8NL60_PYRGI|nr:hypothetical protein MCOR01_005764 [Pyricularia oryzae]KAI6298737.1 hypothetical protein MCOR33_005185 [Pyricularia grisea]KAH9434978.1 hypothetical protein MCOR02_003943 [Pyricularia oryzae]KAI6261742.1 hypothetical protein MCOR19_001957 [Pyricularia oryzae]KAI6281179.1 hypothetical protein MCOR26_003371 [Pyricularia oryzae]
MTHSQTPEEVLTTLSQTDIRTPIPPSTLLPTISSPPFIALPGTFNTRDLGLVPSSTLRPSLVYRSGALSHLAATPDGATTLATRLGVKHVFDLRSEQEHNSDPDPEVPGVRNSWLPTADKDASLDLADFVDGEGEAGYVKMYMDVLNVYREPFKAVLEHIRDVPDEPLLFHCTAGRDRTGVLSGLIMSLAGQDPEVVAFDFMLSRIGKEPAREMLLAFVMKSTGAADLEAPGLYNLVSLRRSCWDAFVNEVQQKYGGFYGYARSVLGFTDDDLSLIKKNLVRD